MGMDWRVKGLRISFHEFTPRQGKLIKAYLRENLEELMKHMFRAIRWVCDKHPDVKAIYPIHMNPVVRETRRRFLEEMSGSGSLSRWMYWISITSLRIRI